MQIAVKYRGVSDSGGFCERAACARRNIWRARCARDGGARAGAPGSVEARASPRDTGRANGHRDPPTLRDRTLPAPAPAPPAASGSAPASAHVSQHTPYDRTLPTHRARLR
ncbi:hypothetical protein RR46_04204 [Papilio xuthus]|uniref:Uncharacterized protein n=1 Tax=Papilio xuthus TaxID=66420 RepID=A0A194QHR3_PAPXU|nr:hypothetical protein RR46_04204 [Papilio xuthus]